MMTRVSAIVALASFSCLAQDTADAHLGKGYEALQQERYQEAASEFRAALELDPKLVTRARFPLAVALFELKDGAARKEFEAIRHEVGDHPNVLYYLGRLDLADQKFGDAIRNLTMAIEKPPFPDTAYYLGFACFKQGDMALAEKWLRVAAKTNPRDSVAQYQLALVYRKQAREEEAKEAFALSAELRGREAKESKLKLDCDQKLAEGKRDEARQVCRQLYDANNAEKLTNLGTIYGRHGDLEAALDPLRRAAEIAPQSPQMQYNLAFTYYQLNRFEEARVPLATALQRWPDLFQLNSLYGAVLLKMGEELPAYRALRRAHELNSQDRPVASLLYLATLSLARKSQASHRYPDAQRYFEEAAQLQPEDPEPRRGIAEVEAALRVR